MPPRCKYHSPKCKPSHKNDCDTARVSFNADLWLGLDPAGHLFETLTWLLRGAQEWQLQKDLNLQVGGYSTEVYAMDDVLLRVRSLFEFFFGKGENYVHVECMFGVAQPSQPADFKNWKNQLHILSLHLQDRSKAGQLQEYAGTTMKDLNRMPADLARAVVGAWKDFESSLSKVGDTVNYVKAKKAREQAEEDSRWVVKAAGDRWAAYKAANLDNVQQLF